MRDGHAPLEEGLSRGGVLADLVLSGFVVSQAAEMHEAPRIATPQVLRVRRQRKNRAGDFFRNPSFEHALIGFERTKRVFFDLPSSSVACLLVYRLEGVGARLA